MTDPTELISRYFDDGLSSEEFAELVGWLRADIENARLFARRSLMEHQLCDDAVAVDGPVSDEATVDLNDAIMMPAIQDRDPESDADETTLLHKLSSQGSRLASKDSPPELRVAAAGRRSLWLKAAVILLPVMLGMAAWALVRSKPASATLVTSVSVEWASGVDLRDGERLPAQELELKAGLVELQVGSGASIIVQGPARFHVDSANAIALSSGHLTAVVPTTAHEFTVSTPTARVVDLGTEFGVSVNEIGQTAVHVFQGHVQVAVRRPAINTGSVEAPTMLSGGDSAVVADGMLTLSVGGATPQAFVRSLSIPAAIDVVDLICGGDGTTHRREGGIDPRTGEAGLLEPVAGVAAIDTDYHPVPTRQVVDGCFVPNGNVKVDSAGHMFDFGNTTGATYYDIRAGGNVVWPQSEEHFTSVLGGVDYSAPEHGLVLMHPNCGITFNLAALRQLHPGSQIARFKSVVGNCHSGPVSGAPVNVYVLVDGVARFERHAIVERDGAINLDVPLNESDRFITIVSTRGTDISMHDWIILGDPQFE